MIFKARWSVARVQESSICFNVASKKIIHLVLHERLAAILLILWGQQDWGSSRDKGWQQHICFCVLGSDLRVFSIEYCLANLISVMLLRCGVVGRYM